MKEETSTKFSDEAIQNISEYANILRRIHCRLVKEGKVEVRDGKVVFLGKAGGIKKKVNK